MILYLIKHYKNTQSTFNKANELNEEKLSEFRHKNDCTFQEFVSNHTSCLTLKHKKK